MQHDYRIKRKYQSKGITDENKENNRTNMVWKYERNDAKEDI